MQPSRSPKSNEGFPQSNNKKNTIKPTCRLLVHPLLLDDSRNNLVRYFVAILLPGLSVLGLAPIVVAESTICEQNRKIKDIEVRSDQARIQGRHTPKERRQDLWYVVKVSTNLPPPVHQQETFFDGTRRGLVFGRDVFRFVPPNQAFPTSLTKDVTLTVRIVVNGDAQQTRSKDRTGRRPRQLWRTFRQVKRGARVDGGHPHEAALYIIRNRREKAIEDETS